MQLRYIVITFGEQWLIPQRWFLINIEMLKSCEIIYDNLSQIHYIVNLELHNIDHGKFFSGEHFKVSSANIEMGLQKVMSKISM